MLRMCTAQTVEHSNGEKREIAKNKEKKLIGSNNNFRNKQTDSVEMTIILRKCAILRHQLTFRKKGFVNSLQRQNGMCVCVSQTYGWLVAWCVH